MKYKVKEITIYGNSTAKISEFYESFNVNDDEVLIETELTLMSNGSEVYHFKGKFEKGFHWENIKYPTSTGYALVGKIIKAGKRTNFEIGEKVFARGNHKSIQKLGLDRVFKIPTNIKPEYAVWTPILRTADNAIRLSGVLIGQKVVIMGLGIFGLSILQYAYLAGASKIVVVEPNEFRIELAKRIYSNIIAIKGKVEDKIDEIGDDAYAVFDCTGQAYTLDIAGFILRNHGKVILISDNPNYSKQIVGRQILMKYLQIFGVHMNMNDTYQPNAFYPLSVYDIHKSIYSYIDEGRINIDKMITHRLTPEEAKDMYYLLEKGNYQSAGILIDWKK